MKFFSETKRLLELRRRLTIAAGLCGYLLLAGPALSTAATPAAQLQGTWGQITEIFESARFDSEAGIEAFRTKLMLVVWQRFDFAEMAKRALGPYWEARTPAEKREFVALLANTLAKSYVSGIRSNKNLDVLHTRELTEKEYAEVDTRVITGETKDLVVNYKLHYADNDWKVYDVVIDDIGIIANFRSQFHRIILRSWFADLLRVMKEKQP